MHTGKTGPHHEEIIREALRHELESASPPPSEPVWERIRAGLVRDKKERAAPLVRRLSWRRLAAAAALLLLFVGGGLALGRSGLLTSSGPGKAESEQLRSREEDNAEMCSDAVLQPLRLPDGFTLEKAGAEGFFQTGDHYPAAVYRRGEERLLWICASSPSTDLRDFIAQISRQLDVGIEILDEVKVNDSHKSILEFKAGEHSGIAWQEAGGPQAFLALSGSPDLQTLIRGLPPNP